MATIKTDWMRIKENRRETLVQMHLRQAHTDRGIVDWFSRLTGKSKGTYCNRKKDPEYITVEELRAMRPTKEEALRMVFGSD